MSEYLVSFLDCKLSEGKDAVCPPLVPRALSCPQLMLSSYGVVEYDSRFHGGSFFVGGISSVRKATDR